MEPDMRSCPVCGEVYYMFPGEVCSADCNNVLSTAPTMEESTNG